MLSSPFIDLDHYEIDLYDLCDVKTVLGYIPFLDYEGVIVS